ncbi:MAG: VWA domain-containing protein, partial [Chloroflexales bacterium]|nr:VWA domain-containing protein [Chloroflexales bacterium]
RRRRLPLTMLLLLHLLAAALIAVALARPQWSLSLFGQPGHTAVVIDTSTSMAAPAAGIGGTRLDAARARARAIIGGMGARETVTLVAAGPRPRLVDTAGPDGAARLLAALDALPAGGTGSDLAGALSLAEAALQGRAGARIVVLTDAALPATLSGDLAARPAALSTEWVSVGGPLDNRALVSLAVRQRGAVGPVHVYGRAVNYGQAPLRTVLRLFGDDQLLDTRLVSLLPAGEAELTWTVPRGITLLRAELDGGDGLPADDTATISLAQTRPLSALIVSDQPAALERALRAVPGLTLATLPTGLYAGSDEASAADLTVFDGYLPAAWPAGGVLAVNPPNGSPLLVLDDQAREPAPGERELRVGPASQELLDGVSLGSVDFGPVRAVKPPAWAETLLSRGEQPLILRGRVGRSEVAIWAFDLGQSNLTTRLAFPLLAARAVRDLTPPLLPASALLGEEPRIVPDPRATRVQMRAPDGTVRVLAVAPGEALPLALDQPGVYTLAEQVEGRILYTGQLAVNAGAPFESDLTPRALPAATPPMARLGGEGEGDRPLWPWLAAAALAVMLFEWAYVHGRRRAPAEV